MRPVSEKKVVLAFERDSSAALKESEHASSMDVDTFIPASIVSSVWVGLAGAGTGTVAGGGRAKSTSCLAARSSASVRKADRG